MEQLPKMTSEQMVRKTDVTRRWNQVVEPRLRGAGGAVYVVEDALPRFAILSYQHFERLWRAAQEAEDARLLTEALTRVLEASSKDQALIPLSEVLKNLGITKAELEAAPDVEIE